MKKNRLFMMGTLAVMSAFGLVLTGCGNDDSSGDSTTTHGGGGATLQVRLNEGEYTIAVPVNNTTKMYAEYKSQGTWYFARATWYKNGQTLPGSADNLTLYTASHPSANTFDEWASPDSIKVVDGDRFKVFVDFGDGVSGTSNEVTVMVTKAE
jgi:hypothetical protein